MSTPNKLDLYSNIVVRFNANRRQQWHYDMKVSSYLPRVATLTEGSPGLWLPDSIPVNSLDDAKDLVLRLLSEQHLPIA